MPIEGVYELSIFGAIELRISTDADIINLYSGHMAGVDMVDQS